MDLSALNKPIYVLSTDHLRDKDCMGLYELDSQSPDNKGFHRYQIILVPSDDGNSIIEYRLDMGATGNFKGIDQIRIPGGTRNAEGKFQIAETVGRLVDTANELRALKSLFDKRELAGVNRIRET